MAYRVALCGLSPGDRFLIEVATLRAHARLQFRILGQDSDEAADIAIVDVDRPGSEDCLRAWGVRNASMVTVDLSDHGLVGRTRHRIARGSLMVRARPVLEEIVEHELS